MTAQRARRPGAALLLLLGVTAAAAPSAAARPFTFTGSAAEPGQLAVGPDGTQWIADRSARRVTLRGRRGDGTAIPVRTVLQLEKGRKLRGLAVTATSGAATVVVVEGEAGPVTSVALSWRVAATRCSPRACGPRRLLGRTTGELATNDLVAASDARGRTLVSWLGPSAKGYGRGQWRLGVRGRFGPLRSFPPGTSIVATTDGRTVALSDGRRVSLAERTRTGFGRPQPTPIRGDTIAVAIAQARGETILAWESGRPDDDHRTGGPGPVSVAIRRRGSRSFGPRQLLFPGHAITLSLAASDDGRAVLSFGDVALGRLADPDLVQPYAALREPGAASFTAPVALGGPASSPFGTADDELFQRFPAVPMVAAMTRRGTATVAWPQLNARDPVVVAAATAPPGASFGAPEVLGANPEYRPIQIAATAARTFVVWPTTNRWRGEER